MASLEFPPRVPPPVDNERIYSKKFERNIDNYVEKKRLEPINETNDYLDIDPEIPEQRWVCLSFSTPKKDRFSEIEATCFEEYLYTLTNDDLEELKKDPTLVHKDYFTYKKNYRVHLENVIKARFPEQRTERAVKIRGSYRTNEEGIERAKSLGIVDKNFHIFVGEVGKWMAYDPQPMQVENYETAEKQLNNIVAAHKQEQQRAKEAFEIRKYGLTKDAERKNKKVLEESKKYLEDNELLKQFEEEISTDPDKLKLDMQQLNESEVEEYIRETAEIKKREQETIINIDRDLEL